MSTRYDRITLEYNVEFSGPGAIVLEPTDEEKADPRFAGFLSWMNDVRMARLRAELAKTPPGGEVFDIS